VEFGFPRRSWKRSPTHTERLLYITDLFPFLKTETPDFCPPPPPPCFTPLQGVVTSQHWCLIYLSTICSWLYLYTQKDTALLRWPVLHPHEPSFNAHGTAYPTNTMFTQQIPQCSWQKSMWTTHSEPGFGLSEILSFWVGEKGCFCFKELPCPHFLLATCFQLFPLPLSSTPSNQVLLKHTSAQNQWLTPVILPTRGSWFQASLGK
jgi:hypothetical protein